MGPSADEDRDGWTPQQGDCDDADATVHPGAPELADGVDQDCDNEIDEGTEDLDEDGWSVVHGDCDDEEGWANPTAAEVCDGIDNNCDGFTDEGCADRTGPEEETPESGGCSSVPGVGWFGLLGLLGLRRRR